MRKIALPESVPTADELFVDNGREETSSWCYTFNNRFDNLSGAVLFRLSDEILDTFKCCGLCWFALHMGTDLV